MKIMLKLIVMLSVIAAVVFAAGCAEEPENAGNETQGVSEQISPATPETGQVITEADNGTSISLKNGENFTLQLRENPSTGYSWELNVTEGLSVLSDEYIQDEAAEDKVGVPGTHSWIIQAVDQGSQQVNGIYKRSWENTTGTEDNFTLAVEVI
ncbi:protease inhibitor I42 family protein [Methanosarcina soligelidi]|uniref:protease inhibitor I42 family protein n=1 Tax=Methanosarcina soligelidi TaxID=1036677 RepID=UPI00064E1BFE|nr:protease inhibitor I42 family protein [Methanosarcina soligelidi]